MNLRKAEKKEDECGELVRAESGRRVQMKGGTIVEGEMK